MSRRSNLFPTSGNGIGDGEGVEIGTEMAPGEPLRLSPKLITEHIVMSEYALVCRDPIDGLYAVPSARDIFEWFGLLFIRRGVYAGTVLRFTLHLPADFPSKTLPTVVFDLDVFHPHVNAATRELDLKRYFVDGWKPDRHHIYHVLLIVQRTFFTFDADPTSCINAEAAAMLRDNKEEYRKRASELIKRSRSVIYDPVATDDPNAIRLSPWDASVHEPLRQRLIGGLTDSQISTMSMLGSLGCGLSNSTVFESRGKYGFSWLSPTDMCYMVEPPRPAELDLKVMSEMEECSVVDPLSGSRSGEMTSDYGAANGNLVAQISRLDLSGIDDLEQENNDSPEYTGQDKAALMRNESSSESVIVYDERVDESLEQTEEIAEMPRKQDDVPPELVQEKSGRSGSEYVARSLDDSTPDANAFRARSNSRSDEVGESDI